MSGRKSKIVRNTMFYSEDDYNLEVQIGMDYIKQDMNQTILVFQVDRNKSLNSNLYGESTDINSTAYLDPVEINVIFILDEASNKTYDKAQGLGHYLLTGNIKFFVYEKTLLDNKMDISFGDYIGIQVTPDNMEYFVVTNDGRVNFDNKHIMYGTRPFYRTISCTTCDKNEFNGI
jgi:hypothetical protein